MTSARNSFLTRRVAPLGVAVLLAGSVAACGTTAPKSSPSPSSSSSPAAPAPQQFSPLTGLPSSTNQTIMVAKVPNTSEASPQVGLGHADMVAEELVEGGITRLAAYFQSDIPGTVGPVRSARETDIGLVLPLHAVIVASGEAPETWNAVIGAGARLLDGGPGFSRASGRIAPYNLMAALGEMGQRMGQATNVSPLLPFLRAGQTPTTAPTQPATAIQARFSAGRTSVFAYQGGKYVMTNGYAPAGDQFAADTVIVIRVAQQTAGYRDPAGNPVPISVTSGSGAMTLFHGGVATAGTWQKPALSAPWTFADSAGGALLVSPGKVWLELVPIDSAGGSLSFQ